MRMFYEGMVAGELDCSSNSDFRMMGIQLRSRALLTICWNRHVSNRLRAVLPWFPYQVLLMAPYILTILVLVLSAKKLKDPKSLALPFKGEEEA